MKTIDDPIPGENANPLGTFDKEEWWEVAQKAKPGITREEYEADWAEFVKLKQRKSMQ